MPTVTAGVQVNHKKQTGEKPAEKPFGKNIEKSTEKATEKAKNVSHVPCKFFRQSMCQAGEKCPFSHELESDSQAVCKYFQKGNCKFGAKCALAHITPDGRVVNKKHVKDSRRKEKHRDEARKPDSNYKSGPDDVYSTKQMNIHYSADGSQHPSDHAIDATGEATPATNTAVSTSIPATLSNSTPTSNPRVPVYDGDDSAVSYGHHSIPSDKGAELASQILSKYAGVPGSPPQRTLSKPFNMRAFSASLPRRSSLGWGGANNILSIAEGSAIVDDEDDTFDGNNDDHEYYAVSTGGTGNNTSAEDEKDDEDEEEEGFKEQLVPSALQDLLTPLERERRNSRNSQQRPNRIMSSPSSASATLIPKSFNTRRGSTGSEPVVAQGGSLWGPRKGLVPFYKSAPFNSPPVSTSPLTGLHSPPNTNASLSSPLNQSAQLHPYVKPMPVPAPPMGSAGGPLDGSPHTPVSRPGHTNLANSTPRDSYWPFQQYS